MKQRLIILSLASALGCSATPTQTPLRITVDTVPEVDFTTSNPDIDPLFENPTGATQLSNGLTIVGDSWAAAVTVFDQNGKLLRTLGGHGEGPGKFGGSAAFRGQCASDSVFVFLFDRGKNAVIDNTGQVARMTSPKHEYAATPCHSGPSVSKWSGGEFRRIPRADDPPLRAQLMTAHHTGTNEVSFGEMEYGKYGPGQPTTHPFVRGDRLYVASATTGEITIYEITGKKLRTLRPQLERPLMTDAHYEAALDKWVSYLVLQDDRREAKARFRPMYPKPTRAGAFSDFYVDPSHTMWITTSQPGDPTVLRAYSSEAASVIAEVRFPVELRIFEMSDSHMIAAFEDDEGFPHVVRYRITRGGASTSAQD